MMGESVVQKVGSVVVGKKIYTNDCAFRFYLLYTLRVNRHGVSNDRKIELFFFFSPRFLSKNERAQLKNSKTKGDPEVNEDKDFDDSKNEEDAAEIETMEEEESEAEGEEEAEEIDEPSRKKMKVAIDDDDSEEMDVNFPDEDNDDVIKEMNLSDFESDEGEGVDDYGENSE